MLKECFMSPVIPLNILVSNPVFNVEMLNMYYFIISPKAITKKVVLPLTYLFLVTLAPFVYLSTVCFYVPSYTLEYFGFLLLKAEIYHCTKTQPCTICVLV